MIRRVIIKNFKTHKSLDVTMRPGLNIIVGDNEVGKSTLLEAIHAGLTGRFEGKGFGAAINPHLFNKDVVDEYIGQLMRGIVQSPPEISVDLFFDEDVEGLEEYRGQNNVLLEDAAGVRVRVGVQDVYTDDYNKYIREHNVTSLPFEFMGVSWTRFSGSANTTFGSPFRSSLIDGTSGRNGSGQFLGAIDSFLDADDRIALATAYREFRTVFSERKEIATIGSRVNDHHQGLTDKIISVGLDGSQRSGWETTLVPHLDGIPLQYAGKGEQVAIHLLMALGRSRDKSNVIMVEEPESHLSYTRMSALVRKIEENGSSLQMFISTHSSFVANRLGLENLVMLGPDGPLRLSELSVDTQQYFRKLPGYDTLRIVLARKVILVEGPSDELIVQRAFKDTYGALPIQHGVDVIAVRGLSFKRFLEIASQIGVVVRLVRDNDGKSKDVYEARYSNFLSDLVTLHVGEFEKGTTLEPQIVHANTLDTLNFVLGQAFPSKAALIEYMLKNKAESALAIFQTDLALTYPNYIVEAVRDL